MKINNIECFLKPVRFHLPVVLDQIERNIENMLVTYQPKLDEAYIMMGDDPLDIAIGIKITPDGVKLKIVTSINFVTSRCKDTFTSWVDEEQINLFNEKGE